MDMRRVGRISLTTIEWIGVVAFGLLLVVTIAIASFCSLTSDPQPRRHPSQRNTEEEP